MKKLFIGVIVICFFVTGCGKSSAETFKEDYESLNGETTSSGKTYRTVSISTDNPFVYITSSEIIEKINNNETFYIYFGSSMCPWCRSVIETAIESALENGVTTIYYFDIWDEDHNEILRDVYNVEGDEVVLSQVGTDDYYELLELLDSVLSDYTLTSDDGNTLIVGEKRIYAPNFIYIENGEAIELVEGISSLQLSSYDELTEDMLFEEKSIFDDFFNR